MFSYPDYLILPVLACSAVALDLVFGETRRYHPLVGFGWLATQIEQMLNTSHRQLKPQQRLIGFIALTVLIVPFTLIAYCLCHTQLHLTNMLTNTVLLYFALGQKSLREHARVVSTALFKQDKAAAKIAASHMVSRDASAIDPIPATIESILENGNDSIYGALFWFFIAGGTGALVFRLLNTMDAMWGYKKPRYYYFGWASARLDDFINYIPARLTALTYAILGHTRIALKCWQQQSSNWDSPNAGPVMAAGAGSLNIKLGGAARYQGEWQERPILGTTKIPIAEDIERALALVRNGICLWLFITIVIAIIFKAY